MTKGKVHRLVVGQLQTNCYLLEEPSSGDCAVIDPGDDYGSIRSFLESGNLYPRFVILTHGHGDHILAAADFNLPVYLHNDDLPFLADFSKNLMISLDVEGMNIIPLKDNDSLTLGDLRLKIIHTPGHTPGGICVWVDGLLFTGDTLFAGGVGRTDLPGGSYRSLVNSIKKKLFPLPDDTVIYPGHGLFSALGREKPRCFSGI